MTFKIKIKFHLSLIPQIPNLPEANVGLTLGNLNEHPDKDLFEGNWIRNCLLQSKSHTRPTKLERAWTSVALGMAAFCRGFYKDRAEVKEIAKISVFEDSSGQDKASLIYAIDTCIYYVEAVARLPLSVNTERARVCGILVTALVAVKCSIAEEDEEGKDLLDHQVLSAHVVTTMSLASGYIVGTANMALPDALGIPSSLPNLTTELLASRAAARILNLSAAFPFQSQKTSLATTKLIRYCCTKSAEGNQIHDRVSAEAHFDAPDTLHCLSSFAKRQRCRSESSGEEETPMALVKVGKRNQGEEAPGQSSSQAGTPAKPPIAQTAKRRKGGKCPRNSPLPCRGKWYSHKQARWEFCRHGCLPPGKGKKSK